MKKWLFALLAVVAGVGLYSCDKSVEKAAVLNVYVQNRAGAPKEGYPVVLSDKATTPIAVRREGVSDKEGLCRFEFEASELNQTDPIYKGTYWEGFLMVLDPTTKEPITTLSVRVDQGTDLVKRTWLDI